MNIRFGILILIALFASNICAKSKANSVTEKGYGCISYGLL